MQINITELVPKFITKDRRCYAILKAIEAGMRTFAEAWETGLSIMNVGTVEEAMDAALLDEFVLNSDRLTNIETIPEWRLDEMAWEYNSFYDYNATILQKRKFINNAVSYYRFIGTKEAVLNWLKTYVKDAEIIEWFENGGEPFTYLVSGMTDAQKQLLINSEYLLHIQNVRSSAV